VLEPQYAGETQHGLGRNPGGTQRSEACGSKSEKPRSYLLLAACSWIHFPSRNLPLENESLSELIDTKIIVLVIEEPNRDVS